MSEIFLSYARADDETPPAAGDRPGWVKFFHDILWYELKQRVSKDLRFWRDVNDIEPDGEFAREIEEALRKAIVMVAVLSPNYVTRSWCLRELESFTKTSPGAEDARRSEQVFKILKHNIDEQDLPVVLQNRGRGYKFYEIDPATGSEHPYFMAGRLLGKHEQAYLELINELAERIKRRLPGLLAPPVPPPQPPSRFVFVAPPPSSSTVMETYRILTRQLETEGFGVLPRPGDPFPDTLTDAQKLLAEAIERAELAIHLIGESSGKTCDGATEPIVPMQLRFSAATMTERPGLRRLFWYTDKIPAKSPAHAELLRALVDCDATRAPLLPERDEVVSGAYDNFLGLVQRTLHPNLAPIQEVDGTGKTLTNKTLYIVAADEDVAFARGPLRGALRSVGVTVEVALPPDRPKDVRDKHEATRLRVADAALVIWGAKRVDWVEDQLFRFRKQWPELGRNRPFDGLALVLADPDTDEKRDEQPAAPGDTLIDLRGGLDAVRLHTLARRLGASA
jgi:hypothetical protein